MLLFSRAGPECKCAVCSVHYAYGMAKSEKKKGKVDFIRWQTDCQMDFYWMQFFKSRKYHCKSALLCPAIHFLYIYPLDMERKFLSQLYIFSFLFDKFTIYFSISNSLNDHLWPYSNQMPSINGIELYYDSNNNLTSLRI